MTALHHSSKNIITFNPQKSNLAEVDVLPHVFLHLFWLNKDVFLDFPENITPFHLQVIDLIATQGTFFPNAQ